jgi:hypothetical protein
MLIQLADFWKLPYSTSLNKLTNRVLVSSGIPSDEKTNDEEPLVIIPAGPEDFQTLASKYDLRTVGKRVTVRLPVAPGASTSVRTTITEFQGLKLEPILTASGVTLLSRVRGTRTNVASLDIVSEYRRRVYEGLEDEPSSIFRLLSTMPVPYHVVPGPLRNWSLRRAHRSAGPDQESIGPVECLRAIFLASIVLASGGRIPRIGFWEHGKKYIASVTHDTESRKGLEEGAQTLLEVETKLSIRSTWNLPSDRYPLSTPVLRDLARVGDIGAHDTRHDGRLILVSLKAKTERATECRHKLELTGNTSVLGFRSPLLQHSRELLAAIEIAGYEFDSSVPSWEPVSPTSQKPHGIGTVFPLRINGVTEIPVTLPQDHQFLRIMGRSPRETVDEILRLSGWIRLIGGACIILVHPDYEFGQPEYQTEYSRLLEEFHKDPECKIMTMKEIARWWNMRSEAYVDILNGEARIRSRQNDPAVETLDLQIVTGYGGNGFEVQGEDLMAAEKEEPDLRGAM